MSIFFLDMCLNGLVLDSTGIAKQNQPSLLGFYTYYGQWNEKPSFKHVRVGRFLNWHEPTIRWMVIAVILKTL